MVERPYGNNVLIKTWARISDGVLTNVYHGEELVKREGRKD